MSKNYKPIASMKEVPEQLRKLRRQYLRYQQAEIIYSMEAMPKHISLASYGMQEKRDLHYLLLNGRRIEKR